MTSATQQTGFFQRKWTLTAFLVEALVLLVFVAGTLGVLLSIFAQSYKVGIESQTEARALMMAANTAETFAATPAEGVFFREEDDYVTLCVVTEEPTPAGTMYRAQIAVYSLQELNARPERSNLSSDYSWVDIDLIPPIYKLTTARYVSGGVS